MNLSYCNMPGNAGISASIEYNFYTPIDKKTVLYTTRINLDESNISHSYIDTT